jgi:small-conductance mechanosensitive channel
MVERPRDQRQAPAGFRRLAGLLLALVLSTASHAGMAQQGADAPDPGSPIAVGADAVSDADIASRVQGILGAIDAYGDVRATVVSGVVTLEGSVAEANEVAPLGQLVGRIEGVVTVANRVEASGDVAERLNPVVTRLEARLRGLVGALPLLLVALLVLGAFVGLGALAARPQRLYGRISPNAFIADIYRQLVRIAFIFAGVVAALEIMGATALLGTLLGAAGIIGLAVGFGVRDTIENFVASLMLSVRQPFEPNDLVELEGEVGHVIRLTSRATVLLSPDGNHIRLPNSVVFKSKIVNYTRNPDRRFSFDLGVDPAEDLALALKTGIDAVRTLPFVLDDPPAAAWVEEVGESSVALRFTGWIDQRRTEFSMARGEAIRMAKNALETGGFTLPEPLYRLRLESGGQFPPAPAAEVPRRPAPPSVAEAMDPVKAGVIDQKVEAERRSAGGAEDLLSPSAPLE